MTSPTIHTIESAPSATVAPPGPVRRWIIDHDDSKLFLFGYVILSVVLTLWISLFWLVAMVGLHLVFEWIKKRHDGAGRPLRTAAWAVWDIKLDLLIVVVAFVLVVYTSVSIGVAGAGAAGRLTFFGFRFTGMTQGVGRFLPLPFKDLILASRIICARKIDRREILKRRAEFQIKGPSDKARARRLAAYEYPWQGRWSFADKAAVGVIVLNLGAIAVGFGLAEETPMQVLTAMAEQLHPWPSGN